jgi:lauroyl/myristoyl acyltransferase
MNPTGRFVFQSLRTLERGLSPSALAAGLGSLAFMAKRFRRESMVPTAERFERLSRISDTFPIPNSSQIARERTLNRMDRMAACWPDRYREEKWKRRCRIDGLERLQELARQKRSVVLPTFHFGPMFIQRYWLRAHDLPMAQLTREDTTTRSPFRREKDRLSGAEWPQVFCANTELKEAATWLKGGGMLIVPIDLPTPRNLTIPAKSGGLSLSTGFARLAARHSATVIPTLMHRNAPLDWEIHLGPAWKPDESRSNAEENALNHTVTSLLPVLQKYPEQIRGEFLDCIVENSNSFAP